MDRGRYAAGAWAYLGGFRPDGPALAGTCAVGGADVRGPSVLVTARSV